MSFEFTVLSDDRFMALPSWVWVTGCWSGVAGRGRGP